MGLFTFDPRSLKMISTSRIGPNCCMNKKRENVIYSKLDRSLERERKRKDKTEETEEKRMRGATVDPESGMTEEREREKGGALLSEWINTCTLHPNRSSSVLTNRIDGIQTSLFSYFLYFISSCGVYRK